MTQDEIIEMAREAGFEIDCCSLEWHKRITAFAKLVAAKEREACAEIAEKQRYEMFISLTSHPAQNGTAVGIANAIRARGEQEPWCMKMNGCKTKCEDCPDKPPPTWVGLSDEEQYQICNSHYNRDSELVQMIEAKLKEKNT